MQAGYTALMMASRWGHLEVVKALLVAGADTETKTNENDVGGLGLGCFGAMGPEVCIQGT